MGDTLHRGEQYSHCGSPEKGGLGPVRTYKSALEDKEGIHQAEVREGCSC